MSPNPNRCFIINLTHVEINRGSLLECSTLNLKLAIRRIANLFAVFSDPMMRACVIKIERDEKQHLFILHHWYFFLLLVIDARKQQIDSQNQI